MPADEASGAAPGPTPAASNEAETVGAYRLGEIIGEGAMGQVYLAEHEKLGRKVAVKLLRKELERDFRVSRRFLAEARAVNRIEHDNVIDITDIEEFPRKFYVMELLKGQALDERLAPASPPDLAWSLHIAEQLCLALAASHDADVVHCDVKPSNVFVIQRDGRDFAKLIDFGIAQLDADEEAVRAPAKGVVGTPAYMSPEQAEGGTLDERTDVYSFGVVLYELVTGHLPFEADNAADMAMKHMSVEPTPPSEKRELPASVREDIDGLVLGCLAKDVDGRHGSMQEVAFHLHTVREKLGAGGLAGAVQMARERAESGLAHFRTLPGWQQRLATAGAAVLLLTLLLVLFTGGPDEVNLTFASEPSGAIVFADGKALGTTPTTLALPYSEEARAFEFRLDGYRPATSSIALVEDGQLNVQLAPNPPPEPVVKPTPEPKPKARKRKPRRKRKRKR